MAKARGAALLAILRGVLAAAAATIVLMLLLAGAVVLFGLGDGAIGIINQLIKLASVALGVTCAVGRGGERGFVTGFVVAMLYMLIGYALYVILGGAAFSPVDAMGEVLLGGAAGAVIGAVLANLPEGRKRKRI